MEEKKKKNEKSVNTHNFENLFSESTINYEISKLQNKNTLTQGRTI